MDIRLGQGIVPILPLRINFLLYVRDYINQLFPNNKRNDTDNGSDLSFMSNITLIDLGCGPAAIFTILGNERYLFSCMNYTV